MLHSNAWPNRSDKKYTPLLWSSGPSYRTSRGAGADHRKTFAFSLKRGLMQARGTAAAELAALIYDLWTELGCTQQFVLSAWQNLRPRGGIFLAAATSAPGRRRPFGPGPDRSHFHLPRGPLPTGSSRHKNFRLPAWPDTSRGSGAGRIAPPGGCIKPG